MVSVHRARRALSIVLTVVGGCAVSHETPPPLAVEPILPPPGAVGSSCTDDADCERSLCGSGPAFPEGYCSEMCDPFAAIDSCGADAWCVLRPRWSTAYCHDLCDPSSASRPCRPGYGCSTEEGAHEPVCLAGCAHDRDCEPGQACDPRPADGLIGTCFTPTATIGTPCEVATDCAADDLCLAELGDGFCTHGCDVEGGCGVGNVCAGSFGFDGYPACMRRCTTVADCPEGWECGDAFCLDGDCTVCVPS